MLYALLSLYDMESLEILAAGMVKEAMTGSNASWHPEVGRAFEVQHCKLWL